MTLRYILFDLDGTLIDTTNLILNCYRHSVSRLVPEPPTDEEILKGFGTPLPMQLHRLYPTLRHRIGELEAMWRASQEELHDRLIRPFPDTEMVLGELRRRGYPLGVVTSKERATAERGMGLYGIQRYFDVIVSVEDTHNHKPHPEPLQKGMELMSATPGETLYVGDSLHDMKAGRAAETRVAAALWGPFAREPILEFGPDYLLNSITDLLELLPSIQVESRPDNVNR